MANLLQRWKLLPVAALVMLVLTGCGVQRPEAQLAGKSVEGRPIYYHVMGEGEKVILFIATIHGNENAGTPLMYRLMDYLQGRPDFLEGYKAVIVPVMNPDGFAKDQRGNANGVDLNRNFPASNRENSKRYGMSALSEPESKIIYDMLHELKPERIVVMHQPWAIVDWDGPGQPLAQHMARHTIHPEKRIGARPGSLGSHAGVDLQIPIITWELPGKAHELSADTLWRRYGRSLVAAITYPGDVPLEDFKNRYTPGVWLAVLLAPVGILVLGIAAASVVLLWQRRRRRTKA